MTVAEQRRDAERRNDEDAAKRVSHAPEPDSPELNPYQVLDCLEPAESDEADAAPRGLVFGSLLGALFWLLVYVVFRLAL